MTIPIDPGPFSFLQSAGQALGAYAQAREQKRQQALLEAKDQARNYLALRAAGLMKPKDFEDPHIQAIFHAAGFGPVSPQETPDELLRNIKGDYLAGLINPAMAQPMSDEKRAVAGAPERGLTEGIDARIAQNKAITQTAPAKAAADVSTANLAGASAEAQLPNAGATAQLGQFGEQQKPIEGITDDFVYSLAQGGKPPKNGAEAYQRALQDQRLGTIAQQIGQAPFDAAVERLRQKLFAQQTERTAAAARLAGSSGTGLDDLARIYQAQQARLTAELSALAKPSAEDYRNASLAKMARARGKSVLPLFGDSEGRIAQYEQRKSEIEQQLQQIGDQVTQTIGPKIGAPGTQPPGQSGSPPKRAAALEYEQRTKGITDPAKRKAIANEIAKKYNLPGGAK